MSNTTAQAFTQFVTDLTATTYQTDTLVPARKRGVDERLTEKFPSTSDLPFSQTHLMGSSAKNTIIRPFDDVDVLAVFSNANGAWSTYQWDSKSFIYRIRNAYSGVSIQQVGTRGQAVRVFYNSGGHVDVAPVFDAGNGVYKLPAGDGTWINTAPLVGTSWYAERNRGLSYHLSPVVRLLKAWNRAHSMRFRSFHLETLAASAFTSVGGNYRDALRVFFEWAPLRLSVQDPGGQGSDLSSYLTWTSRQQVVDALNSAADRARRAITAESLGQHAEAKRLWAIVLGSEFPAS